MNTRLVICFFTALLFSSCLVTQQKYNLLLDNRNRLENQNHQLQQRLGSQENDDEELVDRNREIERLRNELNESSKEMEDLQSQYSDLKKQNENLIAKNNMIVETSAKEKTQLQEQLAESKEALDELDRIERRETSNQPPTTDKNQMHELTQLQEKVQNSLSEFIDTNLRIEVLDGTVSIALPQNLLFAVGSAAIDSLGRRAIRQILPVLDQNPNVQVMVEGHTDPDGDEYRNWDLSVLRSTAVVKQLIRGGLAGHRITAAGRAFYDPIVENTDWQNKAKNRRIEIILSPTS